MRKTEVQRVYLEIQTNLGLMIDAAKTDKDKAKLRAMSVQLLHVKRNMIGEFDEVSPEIAL